MGAVRRESFNSGDVLVRGLADGDAAGAHRTPADQHRAGATLLDAAAVFCPGQANRVPDRPEQRGLRLKVQGVGCSVDLQCGHGELLG